MNIKAQLNNESNLSDGIIRVDKDVNQKETLQNLKTCRKIIFAKNMRIFDSHDELVD